MKIASLLLTGFLFTILISCDNVTPTDDPTNPVENTDKDSSKISETTPTVPEAETVSSKFTYGIDISKYQGDEIELMNKATDSLNFVICRSTEGITYTDPKFASNWKTAKEKGYIRGAYHFYRSDDSPEQQAENFLRAIKDLEDTDLAPIIDFEEQSIVEGADKEKVIEDLWKFIFIVEEKSGRKPIIYTDINIGDNYLTAFRFANYTLWVASYTTAETPTIPGAWKGMDWVLWQKTDNYHFDKIQDDFDTFNGSLADLKKIIAESITK